MHKWTLDVTLAAKLVVIQLHRRVWLNALPGLMCGTYVLLCALVGARTAVTYAIRAMLILVVPFTDVRQAS